MMAGTGKGLTNSEQKAQALDEALARIEKSYGTGAAMRLGSQQKAKVSAIPTSSLALDIALGIGGVPRGRVVEIYGPESSGKCVTFDTEVITPEGTTTLGEIFTKRFVGENDFSATIIAGENSDHIPSISVSITNPYDEKVTILNGAGEFEECATFTYNGIKDVYTVRTSTGLNISCTENHPLRMFIGESAPPLNASVAEIWDRSEWVSVRECSPSPEEYEFDVNYNKGLKVGDWIVIAQQVEPGVWGHAVDQITEITHEGKKPTCDVVMPNSHSFIANGIVSHNTTLSLHLIANAQKLGGNVAFIDAEHALDPAYAQNLGVNLDNLIISQPDTGEQALEIADTLIRSGSIDLIVVDSVAALVPRAELEGEMGQSHVGLQARLMSQALRKLTGVLSNTGTTAVFINQIREKVGVMFGCFRYDTEVLLADGTKQKIGTIVDNKLNVEVLSYNHDSGKIEKKKIVNWFNNGVAEQFLQFTVNHPGGGNVATFTATGNHAIATVNGWESAEDLKVGDKVLFNTGNVPGVRDESNDNGSVTEAVISKVETVSVGAGEDKYDIEVEDNHNYFVDGILVHNSPETTTGGRALKFYASVRMDIRRIETLKDGTEAVANRTRVKVVKNKVAPPFKQAEFDIIFNEGISREGGIIDLGIEHGFVRKSGAWYTYGSDQLGQGKEKARKFLKDNPELADEIEHKILEAVNLIPKEDADEVEENEKVDEN